MARILLLLGALLREVRRESEGFLALKRNHFGAFALLLLVVAPPAAAALQGLILVLVLPALGRDPLHLLPLDRYRLLPLSGSQRVAFQVLARGLNPVLWAALAMALLLGWNPLWLLPLLVLPALLEGGLRRWWRQNPRPLGLAAPGHFGPLYLQGLKADLRSLDPYLALLLSAWALGFRLWGSAPIPGLGTGVSLLLVLSLGTQAQCLLGAESWGEALRARLLPLRGWQWLLVRDAAWLTLLLPLVAPHDWRAGLGAAFAALAVGHGASLRPAPRRRPWHFLQGPSLGWGALQTVLMAAAGIAVHHYGMWLILPLLALWGVSLVGWGIHLDTWSVRRA